MKKPLLSRWGYPLNTNKRIYMKYHLWFIFISKLYESEPRSSAVGQAVNQTLALVKNPADKASDFLACIYKCKGSSSFGNIFYLTI